MKVERAIYDFRIRSEQLGSKSEGVTLGCVPARMLTREPVGIPHCSTASKFDPLPYTVGEVNLIAARTWNACERLNATWRQKKLH